MEGFAGGAYMIEQTSIKEIKGIGEKTQKLFEKVGVGPSTSYVRK